MNCTQARDLSPLALYGDLTPEARAGLDEHVKACPQCREEHAALAELRRLLDVAPTPQVEVNVPALHAEVNRRQARQTLRWRRAALVLIGSAAVLLLALLSRLEVRWERHQFVLGWGEGADSDVVSKAPIIIDQSPVPVPQSEVTAADMQLVKDLVRALADDAQRRDDQWQQNLVLLQRQINRLDAQARTLKALTEGYVSALHTNQMETLAKGEKQ